MHTLIFNSLVAIIAYQLSASLHKIRFIMEKVQDNNTETTRRTRNLEGGYSEIRASNLPKEIVDFLNRKSFEQYGRSSRSSFLRQLVLMIYDDYSNGIAYDGMLGTLLGPPPDPRPSEFKPYVKRVENGEAGELYNRMMDSVAKEIKKLGS